jgi:hypothetical protein
MNWLAEIMPLFFVRWYANRYCERFQLDGSVYTDPRPGVLIQINFKRRKT